MIEAGNLTYDQAMIFLNEVSDLITIKDADEDSLDEDLEDLLDTEGGMQSEIIVDEDKMEI